MGEWERRLWAVVTEERLKAVVRACLMFIRIDKELLRQLVRHG